MDTGTTQKILFNRCFRSPNRTYPLIKTFQGGKTKIFALLQGRKGFNLSIDLFVAQTLSSDQKKRSRPNKP